MIEMGERWGGVIYSMLVVPALFLIFIYLFLIQVNNQQARHTVLVPTLTREN
jgi:hypothetical protein